MRAGRLLKTFAVVRCALPLLVPPGALADLQRRTIEDEPALPA